MSVLQDDKAWSGWSLDRHAAHELAATLTLRQPRLIVESGSGFSTVLLAEYAARTGATVISLEHSAKFAAETERLLAHRGLSQHADIRVGHIEQIITPIGPIPWYNLPVPLGVDFALIDGPPGKIGRAGAMFGLLPHMHGDWVAWLDDADRHDEREAVTAWTDHLDVTAEYVPLPKGLTIIRPPGICPVNPGVDASDVAVTIVTGGRPELLYTTIRNLAFSAPGLLDSAYVAVLVNGPDPATAELLERYDFIDHLVTLSDRLPIGMTAQAMLGTEAPRPYVLHLEDDWSAATTVPGWLDRARTALDDPQIGQVRLRHRGDTVLSRHMVTRKPIMWTPGPEGHLVATAHYTLNPSLMRSADTPQIWADYDGENGAARRFTATGWLSAQAVPGVFRHTGEGHSVRLGQR